MDLLQQLCRVLATELSSGDTPGSAIVRVNMGKGLRASSCSVMTTVTQAETGRGVLLWRADLSR